uniref:PP2C family protein-serine/threonine phosphatase n=1 Tax=Herbidospora sakaeratensis TaxID=564415 RepID=UPI00078495DE|nr:SpoIIE family protein phosphatase [Herbidospora sakaeratensis]
MITAVAQRQGTDNGLADATATYTAGDWTLAAAVIDGVGHADQIHDLAPTLAKVAAHYGAQRGALAGILTAGGMVADPGADDATPTAVGVVAVAAPGSPHVAVAWIGDCRAYGWDGVALHQYTVDHTAGQRLRERGDIPEEVAKASDNILTLSLAQATPGTVCEVDIPAEQLLVLTSDGVHDQMPRETLEALVRKHADGDLQALADLIVAAAEQEADGYRDDATVVLLRVG